jgi:uncharacterized membrane protein
VTTTRPAVDRRGSLLTGALVGVGLLAAVDTVVFHLLLGWHHLLDGSDRVGQVSDGVLHVAYLGLLVAGGLRYGAQSRRGDLDRRPAVGGLLLGAGGFQLFDGVVNHKALGLHDVRPAAADQLPYDLAWNGVGLLLLVAGLVVLRRASR